MRIFNARTAVLTINKIVHHARLQRAGAEQRHQGDDFLEGVRLQALYQVLHAARFQLEQRRGAARFE